MEVKNRFFKKICQNKDPLNKQQLDDRVKKYKKNLLKLIRKTEANHYNNFFQEKKLNLFKISEGVREIINITKKCNSEFNYIQVASKTINEPTEIANELNDHFTTIAQRIEQKLALYGIRG